jgi:hypothetical protein
VISSDKIHINESLTLNGNKLFGRVYAFKKKHLFKFIWTVNGKILLRKSESTVYAGFGTQEKFDDFVATSGLIE